MTSARRGMAVVLALAILLVLGIFGTILHRFSRGAMREVDALSGHLRALSVADAAYSAAVARLAASGWENRAFKSAPEVRTNVAAAGGTYDSLIRDQPGETPNAGLPLPVTDLDPGKAELLVRARWESHTVMCVWRLTVPRDGFEELARIVPTFFGQLPPNSGVTGGALDPISTQISDLIARRERNRPDFERRRPAIEAATTPAALGEALGMPAPPGIAQEIPSADGGLPLPLDHYTDAAKNGAPRPPRISGTGPWSEEPWRGWRVGGTEGTGQRPGVADRSKRGSGPEADAWAAWPGWKLPNGGSPWTFTPGWDGWQGWGKRQAIPQAGGGGGGVDWGKILTAIGQLLGAGGSRSRGGPTGGGPRSGGGPRGGGGRRGGGRR